MDLKSARDLINNYLQEQFGKVTTLREVAVERSTGGRIFVGSVYCVTDKGDIQVGTVGLSEEGEIRQGLAPDALVDALMTAVGGKGDEQGENDDTEQVFNLLDDDDGELGDFTNLEEEEIGGEELDRFFADFNDTGIMDNLIGLLTSGEQADLLMARRLMPKLLVDHEKRGTVLFHMGELELRLDEKQLGLSYLEAAAREFADVGDMDALKRALSAASRVLSEEELKEHATAKLLEQTIARGAPLDSLHEVPALRELPEAADEKLDRIVECITVPTGHVLLKEGAPATQAFAIKSGILGIDLETPGGGSRTVRCCFPGELVGESCVQGPGATCNATVFAKQECELWRFSGASLIELIREVPELKTRLDASRTIHRLDSFFSMNEVTNTLDVRVRDRLIGCIAAIRHVKEGEIIEKQETDPSGVYLVIAGQIEKHLEGATPRVYMPDAFCCLKETLHKLPLEGDVVAKTDARLVVFDTETLFELAIGAPPEVVAVLERLE